MTQKNLSISASLSEALFLVSKYGRRGRLRPKIRPLTPLDTSAWFFKLGFFAYGVSTKSSCAGPNKLGSRVANIIHCHWWLNHIGSHALSKFSFQRFNINTAILTLQ